MPLALREFHELANAFFPLIGIHAPRPPRQGIQPGFAIRRHTVLFFSLPACPVTQRIPT